MSARNTNSLLNAGETQLAPLRFLTRWQAAWKKSATFRRIALDAVVCIAAMIAVPLACALVTP